MKTNQESHQPRFLRRSTLISVTVLILLACSQAALAQATQNKIPKWTDNAGTLGPSTIFEDASGNVGIGTTNPGQTLDVQGRVTLSGSKTLSTVLAPMFGINTTINNTGLANMAFSVRGASFVGAGDLPTGVDVAPTFAPSSSISGAQGFTAAAYSAPPSGVTITDQFGGNSTIVYTNVSGAVTNGTNFNIAAPVIFGALKPTSQTGLRIRNQGIGGTPASYGLYVDSQAGSTNSYAAIFAGGNVGIGTTNPQSLLDVNGSINSSNNINATGTITGGNIVIRYQDVAEWVPSPEKLPTGTVVVLDSTKSNQVIASTVSYDTRVAGVISEQPGIALGEKGDSKVLVATTGRVRVKVDATRAPIHIGDLLVTSEVRGVAMKSEPIVISGRKIHAPGTLIGKALEPLAKGSGEILVLLSLQ